VLNKELVQLIQTVCKNDKLLQALELTNMLHHTLSFDMTVKVASFYCLLSLQEKMKVLKEDCITHSRLQWHDWVQNYDSMLPLCLLPPNVPWGRALKMFQNFGSPAAVHQSGLTWVTLSLLPISNDHAITAVAGEGKRKWVDDDDDIVTRVDAIQLDYARWCSVNDEFAAEAGGGASLPSKPSMHVPHFFIFLC
jgi:hypothetical protein